MAHSHTITVEDGVVVERFDGDLVKVCATPEDMRTAGGGEPAPGAVALVARVYASAYGATFVAE